MTKHTVIQRKDRKLEVAFSTKTTPTAIYEYHDSEIQGIVPLKRSESKPWYPWGTNNQFPQEVFDHVYANDIKPELIKQSVDLIMGKGLFLYKDVIVDGKKTMNIVTDPMIDDWIEENEIHEYLRERCTNLELTHNAFTEMILDGNQMINSIKNIPSVDCRAEYMNEESGRIMNYYLCGDWRKPRFDAKNQDKGNVIRIPAYDRSKPEAYEKFIHHSKYYMPGQEYYSFPIWWHGTKPWSDLSNEISTFQLANLRNGMNVKFHVRIPKKYFDQYDEKETEEKKQEVQDKLDEMLSGSENASKTFYSFIESIGGNQVEGWEIIPINYDSKDETFLKTFEVSSRANSRGHGIHPVLAGIDIQGSLGSGSEILNLYNYHIAIKTQGQKETLLKPLHIIKKINKWDPAIKFGLEYVQLTTIDKNPTGRQSVA